MKTQKNIYNIQDIITANRVKGGHFFSPDTMRFFRSRVLSDVYQGPGGVYFVTSEKRAGFGSIPDGSRQYTVRVFNPKTADVNTAGDFNKLSRYMAIKNAKALAAGEQR